MEAIADQVVDPATDTLYVLVSKTGKPVHGPWAVRAISLRTGLTRVGPAVTAGWLAFASGYLWLFGGEGYGPPDVITQVDPATLATVRLIRLPPVPADFGGQHPEVITGPGDSVWVGCYHTVMQLDAATGTEVRLITLPPALAVSDLALDPAGRYLYVSAAHVDKHGGIFGNVLFEYDARSARRLATASSGLVSYSVAGSWLTAVPGGVWASFRTGMDGLTIHLSQHGLRLTPPPGPGIALQPPTGPFHWVMGAAAAYGGGALWLVHDLGKTECLSARTGKVRASEQGSGSGVTPELLAMDPAARTILMGGQDGVLQVTPPRQCWT